MKRQARRTGKKLLSLLTALCLTVGLFSAGAAAEDDRTGGGATGGNGIEITAIEVSDAPQHYISETTDTGLQYLLNPDEKTSVNGTGFDGCFQFLYYDASRLPIMAIVYVKPSEGYFFPNASSNYSGTVTPATPKCEKAEVLTNEELVNQYKALAPDHANDFGIGGLALWYNISALSSGGGSSSGNGGDGEGKDEGEGGGQTTAISSVLISNAPRYYEKLADNTYTIKDYALNTPKTDGDSAGACRVVKTEVKMTYTGTGKAYAAYVIVRPYGGKTFSADVSVSSVPETVSPASIMYANSTNLSTMPSREVQAGDIVLEYILTEYTSSGGNTTTGEGGGTSSGGGAATGEGSSAAYRYVLNASGADLKQDAAHENPYLEMGKSFTLTVSVASDTKTVFRGYDFSLSYPKEQLTLKGHEIASGDAVSYEEVSGTVTVKTVANNKTFSVGTTLISFTFEAAVLTQTTEAELTVSGSVGSGTGFGEEDSIADGTLKLGIALQDSSALAAYLDLSAVKPSAYDGNEHDYPVVRVTSDAPKELTILYQNPKATGSEDAWVDYDTLQTLTGGSRPVNAGKYTINILVQLAGSSPLTYPVEFEILKQSLVKPTATKIEEFTYTVDKEGNAVKQGYPLTNADLYTVTYYDSKGAMVKDANAPSAPWMPGLYTAQISIADSTNYEWIADGTGTGTGTGAGGDKVELPMLIHHATVTKPEADTTAYTYNGAVQTYQIAGSNLYSVYENEKTDVNYDRAAKRVKAYPVKVMLINPTCYMWEGSVDYDETTKRFIEKPDSAPLTYDFTIAQKGVTVSVSAGQSKVLGASDPRFTYDENTYKSCFVGSDAPAAVTITRTAGEEIGEYDYQVSIPDLSTNYCLLTAEQPKFAVTAPEIKTDVTNNYIAGYALLLVGTNADNISVQYGSTTLYELLGTDGTDYAKVGGGSYAHVYGTVVKAETALTDEGVNGSLTLKCRDVSLIGTSLTCSTDINGNGKTNLNDAVAAMSIFNVNAEVFSQLGSNPTISKAVLLANTASAAAGESARVNIADVMKVLESYTVGA